MEINDDLNLLFQQAVARGALVEIKRQAATQHGYPSHMNVHASRIKLDARAPGCGEDASPVGIATGKGRLDERRSSDGLRDAAGVRLRFGVTHFDFDDALRSFAIGNDLQGQRVANFLEGLCEGAVSRSSGLNRRRARLAVGKDEERVIRGSVSVNADGVESAPGNIAKRFLKQRGRNPASVATNARVVRDWDGSFPRPWRSR